MHKLHVFFFCKANISDYQTTLTARLEELKKNLYSFPNWAKKKTEIAFQIRQRQKITSK